MIYAYLNDRGRRRGSFSRERSGALERNKRKNMVAFFAFQAFIPRVYSLLLALLEIEVVLNIYFNIPGLILSRIIVYLVSSY